MRLGSPSRCLWSFAGHKKCACYRQPLTAHLHILNVQELHETLIRLFKGKIGQDYVERHDYSISTEDGRSLVTSNNWRSMVKKGTVIVMNMIVKKVALQQECASRQRNACPRCYETRVGVIVLDGGWQEWYVILFCYPLT